MQLGLRAKGGHLPEGALDAVHIVLLPVALGDVLLANRNAGPGHAHQGNVVDVVLVELNAQLGEVASGPLLETPALHDPLGGLQLQVLARDIAIKELELAALLGTLKHLRRRTGKGSNATGISEGLVQLVGRGTELSCLIQGNSVHDASIVGLSGGLGCRLGSACRRMHLGGGEAAGWVGPRRVLDILAMLSNEGRRELGELRSKLRDKLGANQVLYRLLVLGLGENVDVEHVLVFLGVMGDLGDRNGARNVSLIGSRAGVFKHELHVENGNNFALPLADVHIAVHAHELADLRRDTAILSLELQERGREVLLGPR
ncbi:hypothetical protein VDGD_20080 [Verticillium dahliae]|nr:hypothetical protein VDGD_20080 [Verticillium dahliae]